MDQSTAAQRPERTLHVVMDEVGELDFAQNHDLGPEPFGTNREPTVIYNTSFLAAVDKHIVSLQRASRIYVICSGSLARHTKYLEQLTNILGDRCIGVRTGMKSHTKWSEIVEIAREVKTLQADMIITLGGGSLTDGAKIVAFAVANEAMDIDSLRTLTRDYQETTTVKCASPAIPIVAIPTTLSGAEYSPSAGGTDDVSCHKASFICRAPSLVFLDPKLSVKVPLSSWLSSGIRAVDHCVETMCNSISPPKNLEDAAKGLTLLVRGLCRSKSDENDLEARLLCQIGGVYAMRAIKGATLGASHGIGHQLGPFGVGHGNTSCVLLPAVCLYNLPVNRDEQEVVKETLFSNLQIRTILHSRGLSTADTLGGILDALLRDLEMPRSLHDVGFQEENLHKLVANCLKDKWCRGNPRPLTTAEQVLDLLKAVL
ncbi:hypothetical protein V8C40DRAFT_284182 [Trichoderma camerunense]